MKTTGRQKLMGGALVGVLAFTTTTAAPASSGAKAPALETRGGERLAEQCRSENEEVQQRFLQQFEHSIIPGILSESPASIMLDKHNV